MTSRRILTLVLLVLCLPAFACSDSDETPSNSAQAKAKGDSDYSRDVNRILTDGKGELADASGALEEAITALKGKTAVAGKPEISPSAKTAKKNENSKDRTQTSPKGLGGPAPPNIGVATQKIDSAIGKLSGLGAWADPLNEALAKREDASESVKVLANVRKQGDDVLTELRDVRETLIASQAGADDDQRNTQIGKVIGRLSTIKEKLGSAEVTAGRIVVPKDMKAEPSLASGLISTWGMTAAFVVGSVLTLLLLVFLGRYLLKSSAGHVDDKWIGKIQPSLSSIKKQQAEIGTQLTSLSANQVELGRRLEDIHAEVRSVSRIVREVALDGAGRRPPVTTPEVYGQVDQSSLKDEPSFPISAIDYLGKMQRFSNIVRPDFQNGILVNDPQGKGELVLIRDSRLPEETQPLFVIPRSTQFQTKQDFYTYYEKYYDCAKPSAGDVWIIDPAVVSTVHGGWQLREKGVLEVR